MSRFFGRNYLLEITTTSGEVLRYEPPIETRFLVDNFPQHANATAGITVFGISSRARELIHLRDDAKNNYGTVILKAGYGDDIGVIFTGRINNVQVAKDGVHNHGVAVGTEAEAKATRAVAVGYRSQGNGDSCVAIGEKARGTQ
ncbi:hypothetical protein V5035_10630, partial [Enterobacter ludwigii]